MTATRKVYDLTARQAAERIGVHRETLKNWVRDGKLNARKNVSGYWMFSRDDIDAIQVHAVIER